MKIVAVRVPEEIKKRMKEVPEDWSKYLRDAIEDRIRKEDQKKLVKRIDRIMSGVPRPPKGTGAKSIREDRDRG
jgi:predicted DNA-binding protein